MTFRTVVSIAFLLSSLVCTLNAQDVQVDAIHVYPSEFTLRNSRQQLQLVVTGVTTGEQVVDLTHLAKYSTDSKRLSVGKGGVVAPLANGKSTVQISFGDFAATCEITNVRMGDEHRVSFDHQALPVLAKSGCSGGSCHGAPHGKAGFRLSLFGSDRELDRFSLTREQFGRRINSIEPEKSLLLKKPTMQIAHQGGKRFGIGDPQYRILLNWIAEGCNTEQSATRCLGIEVFPKGRLLKFPHANQQLSVVARFDDGSTRDVTHLAKFKSSDPLVAEISGDGWLKAFDRGEAAVIVRYLQFFETPLFTFVRDVDGFEWSSPKPKNLVDTHVYEKLKQLQFLPADLCDDRTFIRRAFLDTIGVLPTQVELAAFLSDDSPNKRAKLIDALLRRPEHAKFWAQKWGDLLRVSTKLIGAASAHKFNRWIESSLATNQPYDQFAKEILLASGSTRLKPAGNFYRSAENTNDAMETAVQIFLGTRIQCAKCHNHPFERWTQENYYGLSAFFHRLQRTKTSRKEEVLLWSSETGDVQNPATGAIAEPWVPETGKLDVQQFDRRIAFADWLTAEENPRFAKIEVNRIWAQLMGRGIVEPFDDFRDSNPPVNSPLLNALANEFVKSGFDRRKIITIILNSNTYQASSHASEFNSDDDKYFSRYQPRMLSAEQLVDALGFVTGRPQQFYGVPKNTKATWLPAPDLRPHDRGKIGEIEFLKVFGQPERQSACECERSDDISLGQALEMLNGKTVAEMLNHKSNFIHTQLAAKVEPSRIIEQLYERALCRLPTKAEAAIHARYIAARDDQAAALEDICWALLNRHEFLFQH